MGSESRVRFAVVGQGWFAQSAILPAFANADNAELVAIVSGDAVKRQKLGKQYRVASYRYADYDSLLTSGDIDAVYIALPNSMHCDYAVRAARAGVHVLCEKPMAATAEECRVMIDACERGGVKLMIAYRLHFEAGNLEAIEVVQSGRLGEPRLFTSTFTQQVSMGNSRLEAELAGSPLMDVGVYCINAARYLFRADPTEVTAFATSSDDPRFREVPELVTAILRFPGARVGTFTCGFGEASVSSYRVVGTKGDLLMEPAYGFDGELHMTVTVGQETSKKTFGRRDQIGPEITYFSDCVSNDLTPEPNGLEGLADLRIIEAIEESMRGGRTVRLEPFPEKARPGKGQEQHSPPVGQPGLVRAAAPQG